MAATFKFGQVAPGREDIEFIYPRVFVRQVTKGVQRLAITPDSGQMETMIGLLACLPELYWLLYVLVVPRSSREPGRYQSDEPVDREGAIAFLRRFSETFEGDGRHNLWVASTTGSGLLVYDRHNVIYAYGPLDSFVEILMEHGFTEAAQVAPLDPHSHHYNGIFDKDVEAILDSRKWLFSPLRPDDEN